MAGLLVTRGYGLPGVASGGWTVTSGLGLYPIGVVISEVGGVRTYADIDAETLATVRSYFLITRGHVPVTRGAVDLDRAALKAIERSGIDVSRLWGVTFRTGESVRIYAPVSRDYS